MSTLDLFGMSLTNAEQSDTIDALLEGNAKRTAHFINAHCVNTAMREDEYARALAEADMLLPDGSGIALAARLSGQRLTANLNGTDLFLPLCRAASERGIGVYLLGARPGVAEAAAARAVSAVPGLEISGTHDGYFSEDQQAAVIEAVNASGAGILLVAMGVPQQELWVHQNRELLSPRLVMGVGAQFDFHSGRINRAPAVLRRAGCEWIWRLAFEPRRLARRYLIGNPVFLARAAKYAALRAISRIDATATFKRALDVTVAGSALMVLSPLFLATAAAIRIESPGPVFFRQKRVGRDGMPFRMLKFRSMYCDAEARRAALLASSDRKGVCFKSKTDPRITRVGRFLRRFSIDELPQILNVLKGEMSIVGPRPALPEEVAAYPERALGRLAVKPGITGIWQIAGRADIGFDKMIDMDLAYVRSRSVLLDFVIIALTGRAVISGRGAY